jgi:hypothetical protein
MNLPVVLCDHIPRQVAVEGTPNCSGERQI